MTHRTAEDWVYWYSLYNSGLYNNQWMVFDYKKFTPYQPLQPGAFWIFEQIPGGGHAGDMTEWLENETYWASYNMPYFKDIYNACGYPAKVEEWEPKAMSWEEGARAQIFRRDHHKVVDLASMARIMRYNDYQHDPISSCNCTPAYTSQYTISSRSDLHDKNGVYPFPALAFRDHMGTDVKIVSAWVPQNEVANASYDYLDTDIVYDALPENSNYRHIRGEGALNSKGKIGYVFSEKEDKAYSYFNDKKRVVVTQANGEKINVLNGEYNYWNDTYYDENGEIHTDCLISIFNPKHISLLLCNYSKLKEETYSKFTSDAYYMMQDLDNLIDAALAEDYPMYYDLMIYNFAFHHNLTKLTYFSLYNHHNYYVKIFLKY